MLSQAKIAFCRKWNDHWNSFPGGRGFLQPKWDRIQSNLRSTSDRNCKPQNVSVREIFIKCCASMQKPLKWPFQWSLKHDLLERETNLLIWVWINAEFQLMKSTKFTVCKYTVIYSSAGNVGHWSYTFWDSFIKPTACSLDLLHQAASILHVHNCIAFCPYSSKACRLISSKLQLAMSAIYSQLPFSWPCV